MKSYSSHILLILQLEVLFYVMCFHKRSVDLDFLAPDISPHHLENDAKMEELRQLFLSGGVSFGEIFAQLSGEGISGKSKEITTGKPATSTARLPIKHHFHWEDPPTDLIMKNKVRFA